MMLSVEPPRNLWSPQKYKKKKEDEFYMLSEVSERERKILISVILIAVHDHTKTAGRNLASIL